MGDPGVFRQGQAGPAWGAGPELKARVAGRAVAAFDFDGTLTVRDSFMAFLRWRAGPVRFTLGLMQLSRHLAAYAVHRDRGRLKSAAVRIFLKGLTRDQLLAEAERFAAAAWPKLMRPDALATWANWGERGAARLIVTASPEEVILPFATRLGADGLIGTRLAYDGQGRITGPLEGANCRAQEKVDRLRLALGPDLWLAAAYGDTSGDREMLQMADEPGYRVFTARP